MSADNERELRDFSFPWGRPEEIPTYKSSLQDTRDLRDSEKLSQRLLGLRQKTGQTYRELYDLLYG